MEDFESFTAFISKMVCDGRINSDQYSYMMCNWGEGTSDDVIAELGLKDDLEKYLRQREREELDLEYQISVIRDNIKDIDKQIENLDSEIIKKEEEMVPFTNLYLNVQKRFEMFPDNPRIKSQFIEIQSKVDPFQRQISDYNKAKQLLNEKKGVWEKQILDLNFDC